MDAAIEIIRFLKMYRIANNVAVCTNTSKEIPGYSTLSNDCAITKCPELEIGRNSVTPCNIPMSIDFNKTIGYSLSI